MVEDNPPVPLNQSHQRSRVKNRSGDDLWLVWDALYRSRARQHGTVAICDILFRDLSWGSPAVNEMDLREAFGREPGTQNPGELPQSGFMKLLQLVGVELRTSSQ
jgi:hypothetical protein